MKPIINALFITASALALLACGGGKASEDAAEVSASETDVTETISSEAKPEEAANPSQDQGETEAEKAAAEAARVVQAAEALKKTQAFLDENALREGVTVTPTGLQYEVLEAGVATGETAKLGDMVEIHFVGKHMDGEEFVSSRAQGAAASFPVAQGLMPGMREGLQLMRVGDRTRFTMPPTLAFGERGTPDGRIGPNEAIIYEVELVKVSNPERNLEEAQKWLTENAKREQIKKTESGLQYEVVSTGPEEGTNPAATDVVRVHYRGTLTDGTEFDSSYSRGEPTEFPLNRVIKGWTEGLQLMRPGDKYKFYIHPDLAYGASGSGPIGPNEALIFEVELLEIK